MFQQFIEFENYNKGRYYISKGLKTISGLLISLETIPQRNTLKNDVAVNDISFHGRKKKRKETVMPIR